MIYLNRFANNADIISAYEAPQDALDDANVLIAWYGDGSYCGASFVLYECAGKLYEVNGSHCSYNGLEGQWEPEETTWEALSKRNFGVYYDGESEMNDRLKELINKRFKK